MVGPSQELMSRLNDIMLGNDYWTGNITPWLIDSRKNVSTTHELLLRQKSIIQEQYNTALAELQKPYRSIDKLNKQVVNARPSANANENQKVQAQKRIDTLLREIQDLHAVGQEKFHTFFQHALVEQAFRAIPEAYLNNNWAWAKVNAERALIAMNGARRDNQGRYIR